MSHVQELIGSLEQVTASLREVADVELAFNAAQTRLGDINAEIERKLADRDAVAKQAHESGEKLRKLTVETQAQESRFAAAYKEANEAESRLRQAREAHEALKAQVLG
jgi:chromosome segregation ATPase